MGIWAGRQGDGGTAGQGRRGHRLGCVELDIWAGRQGDSVTAGQARRGHQLSCVGLEQPDRGSLACSVGGGVVADSEVELRMWVDHSDIYRRHGEEGGAGADMRFMQV
jgi:hypothetical protein